MKKAFFVEGNIVDVEAQKIFKGKITVENGKITSITQDKPVTENDKGPFILPGLVDSHIHIDGSLVAPHEFSRGSVKCGTVAAVCDPHGIAHVMGMEGIKYMIDQGKLTPFKFFNGVPPCVPSNENMASGAKITEKEIKELLAMPEISHMAEFTNYNGVINKDPKEMEKIKLAKNAGKPIDGHAPMITGDKLDKYISAGISTDNEAATLDEVRECVKKGLMVLIREGSFMCDLADIYKIIDEAPDKVMIGTDYCFPTDLLNKGHIDNVIKAALKLECKFFNVIRAATLNPVKHYKLPVGLLKQGDPADFIVVDSIKDFKILKTYIDGELAYDNPNILIPPAEPPTINKFAIPVVTVDDFAIFADKKEVVGIAVIDKQPYNQRVFLKVKTDDNNQILSDPGSDILKVVMMNRYTREDAVIDFVKGFGLKSGAIASSICHNAHNMVCVGANNDDMAKAMNFVIKNKGGLAVCNEGKVKGLLLPIAGLMSTMNLEDTAERYEELLKLTKKMGCKLTDPFGMLSTLGMTTIPELRLTTKGLFNSVEQKIIGVFE